MIDLNLEELLGLNKQPNCRRFRLPKVDLRARITRTRERLPRIGIHVRVRRPSAALIEDATLICGLAAIAAGCGWIFPPTAPIVGGVFLVTLSLRLAHGAAHAPAEPKLRDRAIVLRGYGDDGEDDD